MLHTAEDTTSSKTAHVTKFRAGGSKEEKKREKGLRDWLVSLAGSFPLGI